MELHKRLRDAWHLHKPKGIPLVSLGLQLAFILRASIHSARVYSFRARAFIPRVHSFRARAFIPRTCFLFRACVFMAPWC